MSESVKSENIDCNCRVCDWRISVILSKTDACNEWRPDE